MRASRIHIHIIGFHSPLGSQRGSAIVVYDAHSRQLSVRDASEVAVELAECPYCGRPMHDDFRRRSSSSRRNRFTDDGPPAGERRSFVDPEYFGMLAQSQRTSPSTSGPGTPSAGRRLFQPVLRSGRSRDVSGTGPPSEAEFVASRPVPSGVQGISSSAFSPGYFRQFFREERELGRGGHGVVLLVQHVLDGVTLGHFACKRVAVGNDHTWLEKVLIEVKLLQQISHKNLVKYHWVWLEDHQPSSFGPSVPCVWILQEYCNAGDLHGYVLEPTEEFSNPEDLKARYRRRSRGDIPPPENLRGRSRLTLEEVFSFFRDIASGLHHLHSKGYIHRDLKPSNCLLQRGDGRLRVLISDFGEVQAAGAKRGNTGATGTISYSAPEVVRHDLVGGAFGDFTTKSDIFSLGMIVYFMCFGALPYTNADEINEENEDLDLLRAEITAWQGFNDTMRARSDLPEMLYKYLRRLLSIQPNERPSTDEILASIKGGVGLSESGHSGMTVDDGSPRVTSIDPPLRRTQSRRDSTLGSRPGLPSFARNVSGEDPRRSPSPIKPVADYELRQRSTSRPRSPEASTVVLRPRKLEFGQAKRSSPAQQSPRLMLPPPRPRPTLASRFLHLAHHPVAKHTLLAGLFALKVMALTGPCMPFAPKPWIMYPLLGVAVLDLGTFGFDGWRVFVLFAAHFTALWLARESGGFCESIERAPLSWEAFER